MSIPRESLFQHPARGKRYFNSILSFPSRVLISSGFTLAAWTRTSTSAAPIVGMGISWTLTTSLLPGMWAQSDLHSIYLQLTR